MLWFTTLLLLAGFFTDSRILPAQSTALSPLPAQEPPLTEAPSDCPTIVRTAIMLTGERCESASLNQICYGHLVLDAQPRSGLAEFGFSEPGDIVDIVEVQSLRLSALDTNTGRWGVVMMQLEANLVERTDTAPAVQILLFGDAELTDATSFLPGEVRQATNIRRQPSENSQILESLSTAAPITASGRLADSSWLRVNRSGNSGWIRADLVNLRGDIDVLAVVSPDLADDELAQFGPMQAFYFRSGIGDAPCSEAPNSGLLIQTPEGVASISIWMDEVVIQMDATAFIQAQPNGNLTINVLDGTAQVSAQGDTRTAVGGMQISVPLDENSAAQAPPEDPVPYNPETVQSLPVALLNRPVDIPAPRPEPAHIPVSGQWQFHWDVAELACPDGTVVPFESTGAASTIAVSAESLSWNATRYNESTPGVYRAAYTDSSGNLHQDTLQVIAPDRIIGEKILDLDSPACTLNVGFQLQLFRGAG